MENVFDAVALAQLASVSLILFAVLVGWLIPKALLRVRYDLDKGLGRGCARYRYPSGRAVVYEPHPTVRKYINKYALFVNDGYKYLKCYVDGMVKTLKFDVIMLNNKNKVIDTVRVEVEMGNSYQTRDVLLHSETSYVALNLVEADGVRIHKLVESRFAAWQLALYFLVMAVVSFAEIFFVSEATEIFIELVASRKISLDYAMVIYVAVAALIAAVALLLVLVNADRKGIKVVLYDKKQRSY